MNNSVRRKRRHHCRAHDHPCAPLATLATLNDSMTVSRGHGTHSRPARLLGQGPARGHAWSMGRDLSLSKADQTGAVGTGADDLAEMGWSITSTRLRRPTWPGVRGPFPASRPPCACRVLEQEVQNAVALSTAVAASTACLGQLEQVAGEIVCSRQIVQTRFPGPLQNPNQGEPTIPLGRRSRGDRGYRAGLRYYLLQTSGSDPLWIYCSTIARSIGSDSTIPGVAIRRARSAEASRNVAGSE